MTVLSESQLHFAQTSSIEKGYLEGSSLNTHLCEEKVERDISVVKVWISTLEVLKSMLEVETSIQDRVGIIGMAAMRP